MKTTNPEFLEELVKGENDNEQLPNITKTLPEDVEHDTNHEDEDADDSDLSVGTLVTALTGEHIPAIVGSQKTGTLTSLADAENVDLDSETAVELPEKAQELAPGAGSRGKRTKYTNKLYSGGAFWRHNDKDDWKDDSLLPTDG